MKPKPKPITIQLYYLHEIWRGYLSEAFKALPAREQLRLLDGARACLDLQESLIRAVSEPPEPVS